MPITVLTLMRPRGASLLVGTETGQICLFGLTSGNYTFKQLLRSDIMTPVHAIISLSKTHFAFTSKNTVQICSVNRPVAPEVVYKVSENVAIVAMAANATVLALCCEHLGVVFYELEQNCEISVHAVPPGDAACTISCSVTSGDFIVGTRRGCVMLFRGNGLLREIQPPA